MTLIQKYIKYEHLIFLNNAIRNYKNYKHANFVLKELSGINNFFDNQDSYLFFKL